MNIVEIKNLKKSFGEKEVIKNVNLKIKKGEKLAILGPNGSGKSTLINLMLGLLKQTKGEIKYPLHEDSVKKFTSNVGIQFQSGNFPNTFEVKKIIEIVMEQNSKFKYKNYKNWRATSLKEIDKFLDIFQITKLKNSRIKNLSGGERQRLNILLALISNPNILILDEISTGLDIGSQQKLIKYIKDYVGNNKITLIIISHIVFEIEELVDRVAMLDQGVIKFQKNVKDLVSKYGTLNNALKEYFVSSKETL